MFPRTTVREVSAYAQEQANEGHLHQDRFADGRSSRGYERANSNFSYGSRRSSQVLDPEYHDARSSSRRISSDSSHILGQTNNQLSGSARLIASNAAELATGSWTGVAATAVAVVGAVATVSMICASAVPIGFAILLGAIGATLFNVAKEAISYVAATPEVTSGLFSRFVG